LDIIIEDEVSIGANATIVGGIKIGRKAIIADGAVVTKDVPDECFVAGNPARIKKNLKDFYDHKK
jgi:acetyltransferase-like isoleucine patch superfamily enzyme